MTEVDFKYTVRPAVEADRRFIVETTARVRQPMSVSWREWEPFGVMWGRQHIDGRGPDAAKVVESDGVILGFVLLTTAATAVEMLYVKSSFRGLGFGQLLLDAAGMGDPVPVRAPTDSFRMWASRRGIKFQVIT